MTVLTIHIDCKKRIIKNVVYFIKVILAVRSRFWAGWIHEFTTASQTAYGNLLGGTFWHCQAFLRCCLGGCPAATERCPIAARMGYGVCGRWSMLAGVSYCVWGMFALSGFSCRLSQESLPNAGVWVWVWTVGCTTKKTFFKNKISPTRQASAWGLVWKNPKGFLISIKFRGSSSHFRFDHFYSVDFHSALTSQVSVWKSEDWLKIYNVKMVKIEMVRGTSKLNRNQKSFWLLSN